MRRHNRVVTKISHRRYYKCLITITTTTWTILPETATRAAPRTILRTKVRTEARTIPRTEVRTILRIRARTALKAAIIVQGTVPETAQETTAPVRERFLAVQAGKNKK